MHKIACKFTQIECECDKAYKIVKYKNHSLTYLPKVISIDEFKGNADGEKYQCILTDPKKKKILDIMPSRKAESLYAYGYTNGFTEGCNNKIKVLKRISYGIKCFENLRTRILHLAS